MDKLNHFLLNQPLSVDNAISTIGIIHKIIHQMNNIIDVINNFESHANEYTDEQINILKNELQVKFDEIEENMVLLSDRIDINNDNISQLFTELANLRNIMNTNLSNMYNRIEEVNTTLTLTIQQNYVTLYHYIDSKINVLEQLINSLTQIEVFNLYGLKSSIQSALDAIYKIMNITNDITINQLINVIDNGYTSYFPSGSSIGVSKYYRDITINSILNCNISSQYYLGGDFDYTNYYFCKTIVFTSFNNLIKNPFYNFLYLLIQSVEYQWVSEAQSSTPQLITGVYRSFYTTFGYPTWSKTIDLNSTYSNYNDNVII